MPNLILCYNIFLRKKLLNLHLNKYTFSRESNSHPLREYVINVLHINFLLIVYIKRDYLIIAG